VNPVTVKPAPRLIQALDQAFDTWADQIAVIDPYERWTYAELSDRSGRLAGALTDLSGVSNGRVALLLGNSAAFVEADVAIARAGRVKVAINPWLSEDERKYIVEDSAADILIAHVDHLDSAVALASACDSLEHVIVVGASKDSRWTDYEALLAGSDHAAVRSLTIEEDQPAVLMYTSGTTGRPKGAVWTMASRFAAMQAMMTNEMSIRSVDGMVHAGPVSHGSGSKILAFVMQGGRNILLPSFDPQLVVDAVQRHNGTVTFLVPTMIDRLLAATASNPEVLQGLRHVSYGGASAPLHLIERGIAQLGPVFTQVYGSSEAPHPVTVLSAHDHLTKDERILRSAGRPVPGIDLQLRDPETLVSIDGPGTGELWIRGANVMSGYWRNPAATEEALVDGWYRTGDIAERYSDGYIAIVDRLRDMIITGGLNVYPAEVERVLRLHPAIREASVIGVPDSEFGEAIAAFVVSDWSRHELSEADVVEHVRSHLASYKKPRIVRFLDELPKGSTGKVVKSKLVPDFM
jgi:acyl-CoA synthetase (AMP-forming)/AMP-acid ligase II